MLQPHAGATAVLGIVIGLSWARWHFEICRREVPVGLIALIVTVCATAQMNLCHEQHLEFAWNGSVRQCTLPRSRTSRNGSASTRNGRRFGGVARMSGPERSRPDPPEPRVRIGGVHWSETRERWPWGRGFRPDNGGRRWRFMGRG